ncbi:hypothetical protein HDU67_006135 [Dinochytrium kinnereticum]|nr:hypothetical protein HDU67_006135 [Dinochytrium kinnereticum]
MEEQQPLLNDEPTPHHSERRITSDVEQQHHQQQRRLRSSSLNFLDWLTTRSASLNRRELIGLVFLGTLVGTLLATFAINGLSTTEPKGEVSYAALTNEIEILRKEWEIEGAVIGVVRDGVLEYAQAFGRRNSAGDPVTLKTLFEIGSNTKAFTAVAIATLVEKGKLDWETPVSKLYPGFEFKDPIATERATLIDLLSHRTGLPRHDLMYMWNSTGEIISHIKYLEPSAQFREKYQYSNLMFDTAGTLAGRINDEGWQSLIQNSLLERLEMFHTYTSAQVAKADPDASEGFINGKAVDPFEDVILDRGLPSGSIVSDIYDLSKWLAFFQSKGLTLHNRRILSEDFFDNFLWYPHTPVLAEAPTLTFKPVEHLISYGLGFSLSMYRGKRLISHGGATSGYMSYISTLPKENISIAILTNSMIPVPEMMAKYIIDRVAFPDEPPLDWNKEYRARERKYKADEQSRADSFQEMRGKNKTRPSVPFEGISGVYENIAYGNLLLTPKNGPIDDGDDIEFNLSVVGQTRTEFRLKHWVNDTFGAFSSSDQDQETPILLASFLKAEGSEEYSSLEIALEPAVAPIAFVRSK